MTNARVYLSDCLSELSLGWSSRSDLCRNPLSKSCCHSSRRSSPCSAAWKVRLDAVLIRRIAESFIISTRPCWCPCQVVSSVRVFIPFSFGDFSIVFFPPFIRRPSLHKQGDPVRSALGLDRFPASSERERVVPQWSLPAGDVMAEVERYDLLWWIISGKTPLAFPPHESRPRAIDCPSAFSCKSAASGGRTVRWQLNGACRVS